METTKDYLLSRIRELEKKRDFNLSIHCPLVAAKWQREIDKTVKEYERKENNHDDTGLSGLL